MLFRKPFAFLIKYFKVIHFTLTVMIAYLLLKTNDIFRFVGEYMSSNISTIGTHITSTLFKPMMLVTIIGVLVITFIILGLMSFKKKPTSFYIFNVVVYCFVTFVFIYSYINIKTLEVGLLDVRTLKLIRDFCLFALILQSLNLIIVGMRATGFNIKKFDFDQDLIDLEISTEDNEEFEVDVELDTDRLKRSIRKKLRHARYVYVENRFVIHIISLLVIAFICFLVYLNVGVYHKVYQQDEAFTTTEYMLNIKDSYITTQNYHGHTLSDDKKLLVVQYQVRSIHNLNKKIFAPERFSLHIGKQVFHATDTYKEDLYDLGNSYRNEYMTTTFQNYILVYELPQNIKTDKIILSYEDVNRKKIQIQIHPISDEQNPNVSSYNLGQEISLEKSVLGNSKIQIDSYELSEVFSNYYTYCVDIINCMTGVEYIRPSTSGNYNKALLKVTGTFTLDENSIITHLSDLYTVIRDFGTIIYEINGETKKISDFKQVKPSKKTLENTYYIEVPRELEFADHITISFAFRKFVYQIVVK